MRKLVMMVMMVVMAMCMSLTAYAGEKDYEVVKDYYIDEMIATNLPHVKASQCRSNYYEFDDGSVIYVSVNDGVAYVHAYDDSEDVTFTLMPETNGEDVIVLMATDGDFGVYGTEDASKFSLLSTK